MNRTNNGTMRKRFFLLTQSNLFFTSSDEYAKITDHFLSIYYGWGVYLFIVLVDVFCVVKDFFMDCGRIWWFNFDAEVS